MTPQDYENEKNKRIEYAMTDILKKSINIKYNIL